MRLVLTRENGDLDMGSGGAMVLVPFMASPAMVFSAQSSFVTVMSAAKRIDAGNYRVVRAQIQIAIGTPTATHFLVCISETAEMIGERAEAIYGAEVAVSAANGFFDCVNNETRFPWVRIIGTDGDHEGFTGGEFKLTKGGFFMLMRGHQGGAVAADAECSALIEIEAID